MKAPAAARRMVSMTSVPSLPPVRRAPSRPAAVLAVAAFGAGLAFLDATIVNVAFPDIRASFPGSSLGGLSWILNAYNIVFAALLVVAGRYADRIGRRRTFAAGITLFTVASAACALAPSPALLIAARALQAVGAAVLVPASLALVLQAYPPRERAHGVALWSALAALSAGLGPSLGGLLVEAGGWRLAFLVNLPLGAAVLLGARRFVSESREPGGTAPPDLLGAATAALAIGVLTLALVEGGDWGWTSPAVLGAFAAAAALAAFLLRRCARHPAPVLDLELLRTRSTATANVLTTVGAAGFYAYTLNNVLFLTTAWGWSVLDAGLALTPGPFVAAAVARPASRLAARVGYRPLLVAGTLIWAATLLWMRAAIGPEPDFLGHWLPAMVGLGLGAGISFPLIGAAAVAGAPDGRFATATALNSVSRQLGAVLGVALLVAIVGTPTRATLFAAFDRGWLFAAVCIGTACAGCLLLGRLRPGGDAQAETPSRQMYFSSMKSSSPWREPSRPSPDCLTPPNGAPS